MTLTERIALPGPKKLLAIDGGGIRGVLALEVLQRIEDLLRQEDGSEKFCLADYFDYISGTSTGGIIAACLSRGMSVAAILKFYEEAGADMFTKANLLKRLRYKFESEPLALKLQDVFGANTTFGADTLRTLLLLVMRNATTDSPWPLSNNPYAKIQRERIPRRQPDVSSLATRSRQHRGADLLPAGGDRPAACGPVEDEGVRLRRRGRHDVQQPRVPDVPDGDARQVLG